MAFRTSGNLYSGYNGSIHNATVNGGYLYSNRAYNASAGTAEGTRDITLNGGIVDGSATNAIVNGGILNGNPTNLTLNGGTVNNKGLITKMTYTGGTYWYSTRTCNAGDCRAGTRGTRTCPTTTEEVKSVRYKSGELKSSGFALVCREHGATGVFSDTFMKGERFMMSKISDDTSRYTCAFYAVYKEMRERGFDIEPPNAPAEETVILFVKRGTTGFPETRYGLADFPKPNDINNMVVSKPFKFIHFKGQDFNRNVSREIDLSGVPNEDAAIKKRVKEWLDALLPKTV